jgi:hypothetical protein
MRRTTRLGWLVTASSFLALGIASREARACGGLFCSSATPVNQTAERIVFSHDEAAGRVTAIIEILYQGPAERFAWILPVAGVPDVGVSTNALLNRLQQSTNPNYQLQRSWRENCNAGRGESEIEPPALPSDDQDCASNPLTRDCDSDEPGAVSVLASGNTGPYDYQVIGVSVNADDPAQEAIDWMMENGYDTGATGPELLRPYLEAGLNLIAVRLSKESAVGSIRPIRISYVGDQSMIPIRPTAVAANEDMGILVWVLGSSRAVPFNYKTLELNEALLDWFNPQQSYNDVVIAAANETGDGQGFVTEVARPTNDPVNGNISDQLFSERFTISDYRNSADSLTDGELIVDVVNRFSTLSGNFNFAGPFGAAGSSGQVALDGVADALFRNLSIPMGTTIADVLESPACHLDEFEMEDSFYCNGQPAPEQRISLDNFDRRAFMTDVEEFVIQPIEDTVALFAAQPYMTRFYTTLSPDEMSADPVFSLNADLDDVDNLHTLPIRYDTCNFGDTSGAWEADLNGKLVRGEGTTWPLTLANKAEDMPVNLRVLQLSPSGPGQVYEDNDDIIASLLESEFGNSTIPSNPGGSTDPDDDSPNVVRLSSSGGGCSLQTPSANHGAALLCLLALAALQRRRRSRPRT